MRPGGQHPRNLVERLGAALAAPALALGHADSEQGGGRAPADLAVLILVGFTATHLEPLGRAAWLVVDGDAMSAVHALLGLLADALRAPLLFVAIGGILVTIAAGRRRQLAGDFDLACVAAVPIGAMAVVFELAGRAGVPLPLARHGGTAVGLAWGALLLVLAARQARRRRLPEGES